MNERELSQRILSLWPGAQPGAGLADRAIAAAGQTPRPTGRWRQIAFGGACALAVAAALLLLRGGTGRAIDSGARVTSGRESLQLGSRAVAVAEADSALSWQVRDGAVRVEQSRGNVFYRVERAEAPFVVSTPAGTVRVHGTCFRLEVRAVNKDRIIAAGIGAAIATAVTVIVYEGGVTARNDSGRVEVKAGEEATMTTGNAPAVHPRQDPALDRAPAGATRQQLLAREDAHLRRITELTRRVEQLEKQVEGMPRPTEEGEPPRGKFHDFTPEELQWMAKNCQVRYDVPVYTMALGIQLDAEDARKLDLTDSELASVNRVLAAGDNHLIEVMRDLYVELTGDRRVAEALSPHNLQHEIFEKSPPEELHRAFQRLAAERAGLARPPANERGMSPAERLLRLLQRAGDDYQRRLADALGPGRAASLRREGVGLGRRSQSGCPAE